MMLRMEAITHLNQMLNGDIKFYIGTLIVDCGKPSKRIVSTKRQDDVMLYERADFRLAEWLAVRQYQGYAPTKTTLIDFDDEQFASRNSDGVLAASYTFTTFDYGFGTDHPGELSDPKTTLWGQLNKVLDKFFIRAADWIQKWWNTYCS